MGNKHSCCAYASPQVTRKDGVGGTSGIGGSRNRFEEYLPEGEESVGNLQHISEREPEDWDADPSLHPKAGTIFMERSKASIESKYAFGCFTYRINYYDIIYLCLYEQSVFCTYQFQQYCMHVHCNL